MTLEDLIKDEKNITNDLINLYQENYPTHLNKAEWWYNAIYANLKKWGCKELDAIEGANDYLINYYNGLVEHKYY